jgi:hypothetical protein
MIAPLFLRLVMLSLTAAIVLLPGLANAAPLPDGTREVSDATTRENLFVQECAGFDAVTGYTVTRDYRFVTDPLGALVYERRHVEFSGAFTNGETGRAMPYQGEFTRIADYEQGQIEIAGLAVHLDLPDAGRLTYAVDRRTGDIADDPLAVLRELASHATTTSLCGLLEGFPSDNQIDPVDLIVPTGETADSTTAPIGILCGTVWAGGPC